MMTRISTQKVTQGDVIRTSTHEGTVLKATRSSVTMTTDSGIIRKRWNAAGTVQLLSDLHGRVPAESFGRW